MGERTGFVMHFENPLEQQTLMIMEVPEGSSDPVGNPEVHCSGLV